MNIVYFTHSLASDWNHGNAHFLRGVATELIERGHDVRILEPEDAWSRRNLVRDHGPQALDAYAEAYPRLRPEPYRYAELDLDRVLDGADLVIVHEWNEPDLVRLVGERRRELDFRLLFHDTHHRAVTAPEEMARFDLTAYDGALVFGDVLREIYERRGFARQAWTWHEAADTRVFRPIPNAHKDLDLVWIGNWGDGERTRELEVFLVRPVEELGLRAAVHGVRYPEEARRRLGQARIDLRGWLPNFRAPEVFAQARLTVHVPRRPYVEALPGIPTIRVFEALACGMPLVCAPWNDTEGLFTPGEDFLVARDGREMVEAIRSLLNDPERARRLAEHGRSTVLRRHTCAHRADELLAIAETLDLVTSAEPAGHRPA